MAAILKNITECCVVITEFIIAYEEKEKNIIFIILLIRVASYSSHKVAKHCRDAIN